MNEELINEVPEPGSARRSMGRSTRLVLGGVAMLGLTAAGFGATSAFAATKATPKAAATHVNAPGPNGTPPAAVGTVASVNAAGDSFALTTSSGSTVTVDVSSATTYLDRGVSSPSLSNVTTGEMVVAFGTTSSGTVTATSVAINVPPHGPGGPGGCPGTSGAAGVSGASGSNGATS